MKVVNNGRDPSKGCFWVFFYVCVMILLSFVVISKCNGQAVGYVLLQPIDKGVGIRFDYYPLKIVEPDSPGVGFYHSIAYGSGGLYKLYALGRHVKLTTGVLISLPDYPPARHVLTLGVNYHYLYGGKGGDLSADPKILRPWSFEAGLSVYMRRLAVCVNTDMLRWEPSVGIGIMF